MRPFWGIALRYYGGTLLAIYAVGVLAVFGFLRVIGYPISIVHVGLPTMWHKVPQARGWFFLDRSNRAFAAGRTSEGLLYLANSYEFDPANYGAGLALAKRYQGAQPGRSDQVFEQLLREHPSRRDATAQEWLRALLPRGDFARIAILAHDEVLLDTAHASVWMRAFIFATRQLGNDALVRDLLARKTPAATVWHPLLETELILRRDSAPATRAALDRDWPWHNAPYTAVSQFTVIYRANALIALGAPLAAVDLAGKYSTRLANDDYVALRLDALSAAGANVSLTREIESILGSRTNASMVTILCSHLIRHPDPVLFDRLCTKVEREQFPLNTETAGAWFSLLCTAGVVEDKQWLSTLGARLKSASPTPFTSLAVVEAFFRGDTTERRITTFLPILPLPNDVIYTLIEHYSPPASAPAVSGRR
ncbi:MAG TPA: hypothetical protein VM029_18015 [Opitutaceae bacterium]|nr:hypothetical protein [Opitutaceae bacterium]